MPLPKPIKHESERGFVERCMDDDAMQAEFPDRSQRLAVCYRQWRGEAKTSVVESGEALHARVVDILKGERGL